MQQRVLTVYLDAIPEFLDGLHTESFAQWTLVYNLVDRLLEFGSNGELTGNLASDWQPVADVKNSWRFRIADGRTFHDGSPISADDIIYSLKLAINTPNIYGSTSNCFSSDSVIKETDTSVVLTANNSSASVLEQLNMNAFAIRKVNAPGPVYSGTYRLLARDEESITLEAVPQHPAIDDLCYQNVVIKKLSTQMSDTSDRLLDQDTILLSRNGLLFNQKKLPATAKMFPFSAGNSHILSLRSTTPNIDWIKASIHTVMYKKQILNSASHARPINSFFPPGFVVNAPVIPVPAQRPSSVTPLRIGVPPGIKGTGILDALSHELLAFDISITWTVDDNWKMLDEGDEHDVRDGFIAACHLDNQDPVRLAKHYFTGPRRAVGQLPPFIEGLLEKAALLPSGMERDRMIRNFYKAVIAETACIPLFFCPMVVWSSGDVDLSQQEFYGNTFKFSKVKIGESLALSQEQMNLSLRMFAHDFKRPFSLIKTAGQLIEAAASIEDIRRISVSLLPQMTSAMSSVDGMIRELLQLQENPDQCCRLYPTLVNAIDQAQASYGKQNHLVDFAFADESFLVKGDPVHVERIFANLIHNALESAPDNCRVWINVAKTPSTKGEDLLTVAVGNEGSYIEPAIRSKLFETGYSQKGRGRGLGLSIVKSLVEKCGGRITVDSDLIAGTEFLVSLQRTHEENQHSSDIATDSPNSTPGLQDLVLVLIEDDPFLREAWEMTWGPANLYTFATPDELNAALNEGRLSIGQKSVVVTDYFFDDSELTGADVVTTARSNNAFRVLLASDYIDAALSSSVDGSIGKSPISQQELMRQFASL